jgi:hypothetical protein
LGPLNLTAEAEFDARQTLQALSLFGVPSDLSCVEQKRAAPASSAAQGSSLREEPPEIFLDLDDDSRFDLYQLIRGFPRCARGSLDGAVGPTGQTFDCLSKKPVW